MFGPDGKKLSKRHGDTSVNTFKDKGLLPEALFNYMCLLGWAPGNDIEIFNRDFAFSKFDLNNVLPNPAIFDTTKLLWMNGQYIRNIESNKFIAMAMDKISHNIERELYDNEKGRLKKILPSVQERLETLNDLKPQIDFLLDEPFMLNKEDWDSVNYYHEGQEYLSGSSEKRFKTLDEFSAETNIETLNAR